MSWRPPRGRALVLAAHPDDETLGCGGAVVLHRLRGDPVKVVVVTDGAAGDPRGLYRARDYRELRRGEARRAARALGRPSLEFWGYPDGALEDDAALRRRLRALLEAEAPAVVYRPAENDPHPDHRALARAFAAAAGPRPRFVDCRYEIGFLQRRPDALLDVGAAFGRKLAALRLYRSQLRYRDYVKDAVFTGAARALMSPGASYAEAFALRARIARLPKTDFGTEVSNERRAKT